MAYGEALHRNTCGVWYWRWVVPAALQPLLKVREVARSLYTPNRREAIDRSLVYRLEVLGLGARARSGESLTPDDLKTALQRARDRHRAVHQRDAADEEVFQAHKARVRAETMLARVLAIPVHSGPPRAQPHPGEVVAAAPCLSACFMTFCEEKQTVSAWTAKTLERWQFTFRLLLEGLGDQPIDRVRREHVAAFMAKLRRLPGNAQKKAALTGKTFNQLTEMVGFDVLSDGTVNDFMGRVSSFFKWATKVDGLNVTQNPAEGLSVKKTRRTARRPFTDDQLVALFSHQAFRERRFLHPHYYWLMPMSMLTGMRLNELCQLRLEDFVEVEGVHIIRCADLGEDQRGKNLNATRRVPVHSELVRLGILRWVSRLRAAGEVQLFPELKPGRHGHGQSASKWFAGYRVACGITGKQTEVFHSFRHLFVSSRMNRDVPMHKIAAIVGHEVGLTTGNIYWSDKEAAALAAVVEVVGLPAGTLPLIPLVEEVQFVKTDRRPPSRRGVLKSREKRMVDVASRKAARTV